MAKCEVCEKGVVFGNSVSHSHRINNRTWKPNIKKVRVLLNGARVRMSVCTSCLRSEKVKRANA